MYQQANIIETYPFGQPSDKYFASDWSEELLIENATNILNELSESERYALYRIAALAVHEDSENSCKIIKSELLNAFTCEQYRATCHSLILRDLIFCGLNEEGAEECRPTHLGTVAYFLICNKNQEQESAPTVEVEAKPTVETDAAYLYANSLARDVIAVLASIGEMVFGKPPTPCIGKKTEIGRMAARYKWKEIPLHGVNKIIDQLTVDGILEDNAADYEKPSCYRELKFTQYGEEVYSHVGDIYPLLETLLPRSEPAWEPFRRVLAVLKAIDRYTTMSADNICFAQPKTIANMAMSIDRIIISQYNVRVAMSWLIENEYLCYCHTQSKRGVTLAKKGMAALQENKILGKF
jgi:hypothetical protein